MTKNQLQLQANKEAARANAAQERLASERIATESRDRNYATKVASADKRFDTKTASADRAKQRKQDYELTRRNQSITAAGKLFDFTASAGKLLPLLKAAANDPAWYNHFPELVEDTANIAYSGRMSNPTMLGTIDNTKDLRVMHPGIVSMPVMPSFGISKDASSPINKSARILYSKIQSMTSYNKDYEQSDVMIYIMAIAQCVMLYAHINRAYNYAKAVSPKNDYIGENLHRAMGFSSRDLIDNLPMLRTRLDLARQLIDKFYIPGNMDIIARWVQIFSFWYTDSELSNEMGTIYGFVPAGYYRFALDENSAGALQWCGFDLQTTYGVTDPLSLAVDSPVHHYAAPASVGQWMDMLDYSIQSIISAGYQDFMNISGDIEKVYGSDNKLQIPPVQVDGTLPFVYSQEIGHQFMNAESPLKVIGTFDVQKSPGLNNALVSSPFNIKQDAQANLIFKLDRVWGVESDVEERPNVVKLKHVFRTFTDKMSALETMVISRLKINSRALHYGEALYGTEITSCGTEIPLALYIYTRQGGTPGRADGNLLISMYPGFSFELTGYSDGTSGVAGFAPAIIARLGSFKYAPVIAYSNYIIPDSNLWADVQTITTQVYGVDEHKWAATDDEVINYMHDVALRSMLHNNG